MIKSKHREQTTENVILRRSRRISENRGFFAEFTLEPARFFTSFRMTGEGLRMTAIAICFFFSSRSAFACPLCKEALSKMGEIWTALGFNWSIYFMMAMPFLLVGTFAGALYLNYKKHRLK